MMMVKIPMNSLDVRVRETPQPELGEHTLSCQRPLRGPPPEASSSAAAEALPAKSLVLTGGGIGIPPSGSMCIAMWV